MGRGNGGGRDGPAGGQLRAEGSYRALPLIGRATELAACFAELHEAAAGSARVLCLVGEAGIGKTRLLEVLDAAGRPVGHKGRQAQRTHATFGLRSARHLEPMPNGYFDQGAGVEPDEGWFRVPVRFHPPTSWCRPADGCG